jgi:hypothetical protein
LKKIAILMGCFLWALKQIVYFVIQPVMPENQNLKTVNFIEQPKKPSWHLSGPVSAADLFVPRSKPEI